jgi:hypothetical protein
VSERTDKIGCRSYLSNLFEVLSDLALCTPQQEPAESSDLGANGQVRVKVDRNMQRGHFLHDGASFKLVNTSSGEGDAKTADETAVTWSRDRGGYTGTVS